MQPYSFLSGPFDTEEYVSACALHSDAEAVRFGAGAAWLWMLRARDGSLSTVYGYPHPLGDTRDPAVATLAAELAESEALLRVALSPLGAGARLSAQLAGRLPELARREVWAADLAPDPLAHFKRDARGMIRRALRLGAVAEVGELRADFPGRYRAAMQARGAEPVYAFDDAYFAALGRAQSFEVAVTDAHGPAASALFLCGGGDSSYHLAARRDDPPAAVGAANLAVLEGLRECARRGARTCILGGGLTPAHDDPLFRFKARMATQLLSRPTFGRDAAAR